VGVGGVALVRPVVGRLDLSNLQKKELRERKLLDPLLQTPTERSTKSFCKLILILYNRKYKLHQKSLNKQVDSTDLIELKPSVTRVSTSGFFHESVSPQLAPEYPIRTFLNFFENLRRYSRLKMHHRVVDTGGK